MVSGFWPLSWSKKIIKFQVDKDKVATIIAQALQKQTNGDNDNSDGHTVAPADMVTGHSRPESLHEPLPLPPKPVLTPR